jgi:spermidine/putrescine transport system substrate-binding protein
MASNKKRRASYVAALAAASALLLSACGGETTATDGAPASAPASAPAEEFPTTGSGVVNVYNWTDYIDPEELKRFTAETGIEVVLDTYDSNETLLAKLQSGATGYDVIVPSDYMVAQMVELGLLQDIGVSSFPNGGNIKDNLVDVYWDSGRNYSAPWNYGTTGIACNFAAEPECANIKSWMDYFTAGLPKMDSLKDQVEVVSAALRAVGVAGDDLCTDDTAKYIEAEELLAGFKPDVIESDGGIERVVAGTSNVRHAWNGSTHRMTVENPDVQYIYPSEGVNLWADNLAVPVGAPNLDNAKIFINWMMSPESAGAQSNFSGYDNGIKGSDAFMDESLKTDPAVVVPADKQALLSPLPNCSEEVRELYTQVFTTWQDSQS